MLIRDLFAVAGLLALFGWGAVDPTNPTNLPLARMRKSVKCYPSSPNGMTHREVRNCPPLGGPSPGQRIDPKYINPENFIRIRPKLF